MMSCVEFTGSHPIDTTDARDPKPRLTFHECPTLCGGNGIPNIQLN